jgi:PAS domain S-box-containing protein
MTPVRCSPQSGWEDGTLKIGPRILLVDENAQDRALAATVLSRHLPEARLDEVDHAADFARALGAGRFDILITEFHLSWSDGTKLLAAVRDSHPEIPVLFFCAAAEVLEVVEAMKGGVADFLFKTSTGYLRLPQAVEEALDLARQRRLVARSEPWLQTLLDRANVGVFRSTLDERLIESNTALLRLLGVNSVQEALRVDLPAPYFRSEGRDSLLARLSEQGQLQARQVEVRRPDGSLVWLSLTEVLLLDVDGDIVIDVLVQDVSPYQKTRQELEQRLVELEGTNARLGEFASMASHELQEPLRIVEKYSALVADEVGSDAPEQQREALDFIRDGARRMRDLVEDLLQFARLETEARAFEACDCNSLVEEAAKNLLAAVEENGARIEREGLPTVLGDRAQLVLLLQNLLSNALKFRGDAPPEIHISADRKDDEWVFSVEDNGIGIEPKRTADIFKLFHRLHPELPGTGIGLALCQRIAERHGGRLWVESRPGEGSTFFFSIPEGGSETAPEAPADAPAERSGSQGR